MARNIPLLVGALGVLVMIGLAALGPDLARSDPNAWHLVEFYPSGDFATAPIPPGPVHPLGTDSLGRDLLSRLLWGARLTVTAVVIALAGRTILALGVGFLSAWRPNRLGPVMIAVTDAVAGLPQLLLAFLLVVVLGGMGFAGFALALALVGWSDLAQFIDAETRHLAHSEHVRAARALGARDRDIVGRHILGNLVPQLAGLLALEAGSVLLLLAELGFIGFFISGGTVLLDDLGRPILPVRDRAPEWGQMLAGARAYALSSQWVAFVPAIVVAVAVFVFNLFGEGIRRATEPRDDRHLSPRTLGLVSRIAVGVATVALVSAGVTIVLPRGISFEDGLGRARDVVAREAKGAVLIGAAVRFMSSSHGLAQPEKLNYYFRSPDASLLRVGFVDADPNALEVKPFNDEDGLADADAMLGPWQQTWQVALERANQAGGDAFRAKATGYGVRVVLRQTALGSTYLVDYGVTLDARPSVMVPVDARTGRIITAEGIYRADATRQAQSRFGMGARLLAATGVWSGAGGGPGRLISYRYVFGSADPRVFLLVLYDSARGLAAETSSSSSPTIPGVPLAAQLGGVFSDLDLETALSTVEDHGGRSFHAELSSDVAWFASLTLTQSDHAVVEARYTSGQRQVRFLLDLATGAITSAHEH